jgi:ferredoxin-NADP reductase
MHDNLLSVIVTRKWQLAENYHAVELQTRSRSELPSFDDGACVTLVVDNVIYKERIYPLCCFTSRPRAYVIAVRQGDGDTNTKTADISLSQGDEAFVGAPRSPTVILDGCTRSILFAGGVGAASIVGIANRWRVKCSSCTTSLDHLNVQSFGKNLTRLKAKVGSITILAWMLTD